MINEGATRGPGHIDYPDHVTDNLHTTSQIPLDSILDKIASVPSQSFSDARQPAIGASVMVYTEGDAQKWRVSHIRQSISITLQHNNSEMIVDKSWFMYDINMGSLVL